MSKKLTDSPAQEGWYVHYWRPSMAWTYMAIVIFDFLIAPSVTFYLKGHGVDIPEWKSLTLENGGIIHVAFGFILGITAYGRTKERTAYMDYMSRFGDSDDDYSDDDRYGNRKIEYEDR